MSTRARYDQDPNYPAFVERYGNDIVAFAREVLGMTLAHSHAKFLCAAAKPGARLGALAYEEVPQRNAIAPLAIWRLLCRPGAQTRVVCPSGLLKLGDVYRQLALRAAAGSNTWIRQYMRLSGYGLRLGSGWGAPYVGFHLARPGSPEELAGVLGPDHLWLIEDAGAIPVPCAEVMRASLEDHSNGMVFNVSTSSTCPVLLSESSQPCGKYLQGFHGFPVSVTQSHSKSA